MNKKFRLYTINALIFFSTIMFLFAAGVLVYSRIAGTDKATFSALTIIVMESSFSLLFIFVYKLLFSKTSSPEVFFIIIALSGISFEPFRAAIYLTHLFSKLYVFYSWLPRLIYFGKLITTLALFISGLFSTGFPIKKQDMLLGLAFLFAFLLATTVPIDFSVNGYILLPGSRSPYIMRNILYSFYLLTFINYIAGSFINRNGNFAFVGAGLALSAAGIELIFPLYTETTLFAGFVLFIFGMSLSAYKLNKIYSWV